LSPNHASARCVDDRSVIYNQHSLASCHEQEVRLAG
jgi:hypothetical protein